jgi:hypothetical protein
MLIADMTKDNVKAITGYLGNGTKHMMRELFDKYKTDSTLQHCIEAAVFDTPLPQFFGPVVRIHIYLLIKFLIFIILVS